MARKLPKLAHVKFVRAKGRVYAYFNTGQKKDGKPIYTRLPDPSAPNFYQSLASCEGGRTKRQALSYTVAHMADDYMRSPDFRRKRASTQKVYQIHLAKVIDHLGEFPVADLQASDVREVLDGEGWGAGTQNLFVAVIGAIYKWGRVRGKTDLLPTKDIAKLKTGQHEPWPDHLVEAALKCDDQRIRLAVHLLFYTGQRIGDVCAMRWHDVRDGRVRIVQAKREKIVDFTVHSALQAELDRTPRVGITILTDKNGRRVREDVLREELKAFAATHGIKRVPHGLRKNAVIGLLEAGCTIAEVSAVTGQTFQTVEYYAARVDKAKLGNAAMLKFERRASE